MMLLPFQGFIVSGTKENKMVIYSLVTKLRFWWLVMNRRQWRLLETWFIFIYYEPLCKDNTGSILPWNDAYTDSQTFVSNKSW